MAFTDFTFPEVLTDLALAYDERALHAAVAPLALTDDFRRRLETAADLAVMINTEKARSEFVIAPVLFELRLLLGARFGLFSGVELKADPKAGLAGVCDFILTRSPVQLVVSAPLVTIVEAKNDNIRNGLGQCIAAMVAARLVNEREGSAGVVHGLVTTGTAWLFLRLDDRKITVEPHEYLLTQIDKVMGVLGHIVG
jgi:hypothetical protein